MRERIDVLIFFIVLILGVVLFLYPSYSSLKKEESLVKEMRLELTNSIEELSKLKDTLNMLSKERENLMLEGRRRIFDKKSFSIFLKELSILLKKHNIVSFSITPEEGVEVQDLPSSFPFKVKKIPVNFQFIGKYQDFMTFFQDLELQNYPIRFTNYRMSLVDDNGTLNFQGKIEIYLLEGE